jgi:membrane protease YdiL (CAAX protease family)
MPGWPGSLLIVVGGLVAVVALGAIEMVRRGDLDADVRVLGLELLLGAIAFVIGLVYVAIRQIRMRRVLPPERYRGPSVFILLGLALVTAAVLTAPFTADALALQTGDGVVSPLGSAVILVAAQVGLLVVGYLFVYRPRALAALPAFAGRDPRAAIIAGLGWGVLAWIGSSVVLILVAALLTALGQPPPVGPAEQAIAMLDPLLVVVSIVIVAPLVEELFFRGIVFNAWRREAGRLPAYVGSAALFAAIHLSLVSLLPIFLLGLALAWVYERTGSLLAAIVMHATVNGISVAVALAVRFGMVDVPVSVIGW